MTLSEIGLKEFIQELHIAERNLDAAKMDQLVAEEYLGIGDHGEHVNKTILLKQFNDPDLIFDFHEVDEVVYQIYGEVGIATGRVRLAGQTAVTKFEGDFIFTDVCHYKNARWQVVFSQMTPKKLER